ncbi:vacuolar protein sorting-associated protein 18 homolog isoform X1 [Diorhabda carinulata]|uniref:vacuolar protein sorting-associated protein 18 homolog isoform X1 n=1 Tax=Diorhabda carinulata TaxID=1163345 RepID=UPI0025A04E1F|nr:vacuolar protein sorting-associated protein 18 homolog isoform X1 [Diorhabda carinulata]
MTSMFEQFEQPDMKTKNVPSAEMSMSAYINVSLEQEAPIFSKSKKDFTPSERITHVAIANKYLIIVMANSVLFRMNLNNPQQTSEISLSKYTSTTKITNLFLDPTGNHLLITFVAKNDGGSGPEILYLSKKLDKVRTTSKFRGNDFTAVAWNPLNESENTTGPILLGTSKGLIFETEITLEGEKFFTSSFSSSLEQYWRQLPHYLPLYGNRDEDGLIFDIGKGTDTPINNLEFHKLPRQDKYVVIVTTPSRFYYFTGSVNSEDKPILQQVFNKYLNVPEKDTYMECKNNNNLSKLQLWSENLNTPDSFAWITEEGISFSQIDISTDNIESISLKTNFISYPKSIYEDSVLKKFPIAVALTQFHILLAYTDSVKGVCLLNQEIVYEDNYNEAFGRLINLIKDVRTGDIWAVTENSVFRFKVTREERNIWQIFCDKGEFELAKKYSKSNIQCYNHVLIKEADKLFGDGKYELSAQRYAETECKLEEVCLKFIEAGQSDALKMFLRCKMNMLKPQDKTQITMIVLWVMELYLIKLEEGRLLGMEESTAYVELQKELDKFIAMDEVSNCIKNNKSTVYNLLSSHGDKTNLLKLTIINKDFEQIIQQHIFKNNFHDALEVLKSQKNYALYYHFTPILMQMIPKHMVKVIIEQGKKLAPLKLLPAMVTCNSEFHAKEIIHYLEFCIDKLKNTDKAIHNFLISLYAKYDSEMLMKYLDSQGQELSLVNYDIHYALRLCHEHKQDKACVKLFGLLGMWKAAVDLALTIDIDLAKTIVNMSPEDDFELKKKLWLKIAEHLVKSTEDIQQIMEFMQQCEFIKIEDVLPFFPDFVTIDYFKDAICNSLKEYNQNIQNLKEEMEEATKSAKQVREEIEAFRNHHTIINTSDNCEVCNKMLLIKSFYMFPCRHMFHSDCLLTELSPFLGPAKRNRLSDLNKQLSLYNNQFNLDNLSTGSTGMSHREQLRAEIDNILASECPYCGEIMIKNIDQPFIEDHEYEMIMKEWE